jgi:hypothetical protein
VNKAIVTKPAVRIIASFNWRIGGSEIRDVAETNNAANSMADSLQLPTVSSFGLDILLPDVRVYA